MDALEYVELKYLKKYVVFIEFVVENGANNPKLNDIATWINLNARIKRKKAEQIERIFKLQYKMLLRKNKPLPRWIHEIFEDEITQIELLSSDNDEDNVDDVKKENLVCQIDLSSNNDEDNNGHVKTENFACQMKDSNPTDILRDKDNVEIEKVDRNPTTNMFMLSNELASIRHHQDNNPVVLLEKLTSSQVQEITNKTKELNEKSAAVLDVVLVKSKYQNLVDEAHSQCKMNLNKKTTNVTCVSNTDSGMTERNTQFCVICNSKPQNLTNHFIRMHKTESYVSRLSNKDLDCIRNTTSLMVPLEEVNFNNDISKTVKLSAMCVFCETLVVDNFMNFYEHFSFHTGEYAYSCNWCKLKKPYCKDILSHQMRAKNCSGTGVSTFYSYSCKDMVIYIYRCILCNFVQLNSANISKHIIDHHGNRNDANTIERLVIAKFDVQNN